MSTAELDEATIARWWHEQSAAQGLSDEIEPARIQRVYVLALTRNDDGPGVESGPPLDHSASKGMLCLEAYDKNSVARVARALLQVMQNSASLHHPRRCNDHHRPVCA